MLNKQTNLMRIMNLNIKVTPLAFLLLPEQILTAAPDRTNSDSMTEMEEEEEDLSTQLLRRAASTEQQEQSVQKRPSVRRGATLQQIAAARPQPRPGVQEESTLIKCPRTIRYGSKFQVAGWSSHDKTAKVKGAKVVKIRGTNLSTLVCEYEFGLELRRDAPQGLPRCKRFSGPLRSGGVVYKKVFYCRSPKIRDRDHRS